MSSRPTSVDLIVCLGVSQPCQTGTLSPMAFNHWSADQLRQILALTGLPKLPRHYNVAALMEKVVENLTTQSPVIYALTTQDQVLLNTDGVKVNAQGIFVGAFTRKARLERTEPQHAFNVFVRHLTEQSTTFLTPPQLYPDGETMLQKQHRIMELQKQLEACGKKLEKSNYDRVTKEFQDAQQLYQQLQHKIDTEARNLTELKMKNAALLRELEQRKAEVWAKEGALRLLREQLGDQWETRIREIPQKEAEVKALKQRVQELEQAFHKKN